jgi:predicted metal-dependent phosphotriesterase family hydrolase
LKGSRKGGYLVHIETVLGKIPAIEAGVFSSHEHILIDLYWHTGDIGGLLNDKELAIKELEKFKQAGGETIVELTNIGLRRDPTGLKEISERTGVNIIMGSGWYRQPFYPHDIEFRSTNDLANEIINDVTIGVDQTGIKAGVIGEIGANLDYVTPAEERVHRASARAANKTGAAIITHSVCYPVGLAQLVIFEEEGTDLRKVVIGHADSYPCADYHEAIIKRGAYILFDGFGANWINPERNLITMLVELLKKGFVKNILLGTDVCTRSYLHEYNGVGYDHLFLKIIPALKEAGISDEQIQIMMRENPTEVFSFV